MLSQMYRQVEEEARSIVANYATLEDAEDSIIEQADYLIPVMYSEVIKEWEAIPAYDANEYYGEYSIINQMQAAILEWYENKLRECVEALYEEREEAEDDDA